MKTFLEQLQDAVGGTFPIEDIINNLSADEIVEEVKLYALEACKEALKNSNFRFEKHYYLDNFDMPFEKNKIRELITDEENIPKEVKIMKLIIL